MTAQPSWRLVPAELTPEWAASAHEQYGIGADDEFAKLIRCLIEASPPPPVEWREQLARVIDPKAFNGFDNKVSNARPRKKAERDEALSKADTILAIIRGGG